MTVKTDDVKSDTRDEYPQERLQGGSGTNGLTHWVTIAAQGLFRCFVVNFCPRKCDCRRLSSTCSRASEGGSKDARSQTEGKVRCCVKHLLVVVALIPSPSAFPDE